MLMTNSLNDIVISPLRQVLISYMGMRKNTTIPKESHLKTTCAKVLKTAMIVLLSISLLAALVGTSNGANILILHPMDLKSQAAYLRPLSRGLAERNHTVTVVSSDEKAFDREKMEIILTHNLSYMPFQWNPSNNFLQDIMGVHHHTEYNSRVFLSSSPVHQLMSSNRTFDAVIANTMFVPTFSIIAHRFKALHIDFVPQGEHPYSCIYSGNLIRTDGGFHPDKTTLQNFLIRVINTLKKAVLLLYRQWIMLPDSQKIVEDLCQFEGYESRPPLKQLLLNKSVLLANSHPTLSVTNYASSVQKDVAGISIERQSPTPDIYEKFIGESNGFILISWGSMQTTLTENTFDTILEALSRLPYQVIWKYQNTYIEKKIPVNVMLSSWLPQPTLLGDKRAKLFWTHGGFSSMVEAVHYALPVVVTPIAFDQPVNADFMIRCNMGLMIPFENLTIDSILWTINEVIDNPKYKNAAVALSRKFKSRPIPPLYEAIASIEHAITFKDFIDMDNNHTIALFVLTNFDVFVLIILCLVALITCTGFGLRSLYYRITQKICDDFETENHDL